MSKARGAEKTSVNKRPGTCVAPYGAWSLIERIMPFTGDELCYKWYYLMAVSCLNDVLIAT